MAGPQRRRGSRDHLTTLVPLKCRGSGDDDLVMRPMLDDETLRAALDEPWGELAAAPHVVAHLDALHSALAAYRAAAVALATGADDDDVARADELNAAADALDVAAQALVALASDEGGRELGYRVEGVVRLAVRAVEGVFDEG